MSDHSELFVASIASALNSSQIPCVLWSHCLLNVHGIPSMVAKSVDFVLPDNLLVADVKALEGLPIIRPCPDPEERHTPPPPYHLHINESQVTVGLYLHSETLWFLPVFDSSLLHPETSKLPPHFILASDQTSLPLWRPGRRSGVFKSAGGPVVVPKAHVLLEAFLRLYARDSGKRIGACGMAMIAYVEQYVDDDGLLDVSQLPEPLKTSYGELRQGDKPVRQWTRELKQALQLPKGEDGSDEEDNC
ncbi:thioredoxin reductase [Colletotrichum incanum]|uniref:Thioredoxin reductase n=1 Tax=Colletotrichum incanum TaxID=1573173 RepID=A0A167EBN7_COLIC|nr:thioredoxin reductase [Colletotrichum incanum]